MLPRKDRLRSSSDFKRVYGRGVSAAGRLLVVYVLPEQGEYSRLGLSVSRKIGGAAARNKVRRRLSEAYAAVGGSGPAGADIVIIARSGAAEAGYQNLVIELERLLKKTAGAKETGA